MATTERIELGYNEIKKETDKAICLNVCVSWNGNSHDRDIWFPKSVIEFITFTTPEGKEKTNALVAKWFLLKQESANAFHGYGMRFETAFWDTKID